MVFTRRSLMLVLPVLALSACDLGSAEDTLSLSAPPTLRLELSDNGNGGGANAAGELQEAVAIIHAAAAHVAGSGWHTIMEGRVEVDFLRLADHAADLGIANIPAGKVTQIRLYVLEDEEAYVTDASGDRHPLLTPSGSESGIKVKGAWSIGECEAGTLVLSTNGKKAIHIHGRGADDSYILRPVIRADRFEAEDIEGCVPGGGGSGDGDPGVSGEGEGEGEAGDVPGEGEGEGDPTGEGDDGCYSPEGGIVGDCEGGDGTGATGSDGDGTGTGDGSVDGSGDGTDGDGTGTGDGSVDGSGDGTDGDGTGTADGSVDGSGDGTDGDGTGTGDGSTGTGDGSTGTGGGSTGDGTESELCYSPEGGGFFTCPE